MEDESGPRDRTGADGDRRERTVRLAVPEMDCPSCAGKVESSLERVDGVLDAMLNPTAGTATVTYEAGRTNERAVVAAVEGAGYEVVRDGGIGEDEAANDGARPVTRVRPPEAKRRATDRRSRRRPKRGRARVRRRRGSVRSSSPPDSSSSSS